MYYVAKNLFNSLFIVNLEKEADLNVVYIMNGFFQHAVPTRIGMLLVTEDLNKFGKKLQEVRLEYQFWFGFVCSVEKKNI